MPDLTGTKFYQSLQAPFSEALEVAQVATDSTVEHRGSEPYPPVLSAREFAGHVAMRSDVIAAGKTEADLTRHLFRRLLEWTGEDFFELVPLSDTETGFRITPQGMRTAEKHIRDHSVDLMQTADRLSRKITEEDAIKASYALVK